jgi:putative MFS transporter
LEAGVPLLKEGDIVVGATNAAARLDRLPLTPLHWAILLLTSLGLLFDVAEAGLSNALSAIFSAPPHLVAPGQLSLLLASVFIGGAIGAPLLGWLADRKGRRLALAIALLVLTITSLLAATSTSIEWLTFYRTLSGIAMGSYPVLMAAYLSDVLPPKRRGTLILMAAAIGFLGAPAVIFLARWLTPLQPLGFEAWRWVLSLGAIGSAVVGCLFFLLPESPRWLAAAGRHNEADAECRRFEQSAGATIGGAGIHETSPAPSAPKQDMGSEHFWSSAGRDMRWRAVLFCGLELLCPWATIGFPLLAGAVLIQQGFRVNESLLYVGVAMFGPTAGVLIAALLADRIERWKALALCGVAMALTGLAFAASDAPFLLMAAGLVFQMLGAIYIVGISVYTAEAFPTRIRAVVSSTAWAINRVVSALVPLGLLPLLKSAGALTMFSVIAIALVTSAALVSLFGPRGITGRALH